MKVLWFTNVPFPAACTAVGRRPPVVGGWLPSLGGALLATSEVELVVASFVPGGQDESVVTDGCRHEMIAIPPRRFADSFWFGPSSAVKRKCCELAAAFQPDVVHIHGTEGAYGLLLAEKDFRAAAVISLQGFLGAYRRFDAGGLSAWTRAKNCTLRDLVGRQGMVRGPRITRRRIDRVESRILRSRAVFVGRTTFDRACLRAVNPEAVYCHCDEVMRPPFYVQQRDAGAVVRQSVFAPSGDDPRKGFHCLLKAVALLTTDFPDIRVRVPGVRPTGSWLATGYQRCLHRLMRQLRLEDRVQYLGELSPAAMAAELGRAHAFAFPSFADNSPNGLVEAMLVGVPVVTAFVGGVPSLVRHEETALCCPTGDEIVMAECIRSVLADDAFALRLADTARQVAHERHNPATIASRMLEVYRKAIGLKARSD